MENSFKGNSSGFNGVKSLAAKLHYQAVKGHEALKGKTQLEDKEKKEKCISEAIDVSVNKFLKYYSRDTVLLTEDKLIDILKEKLGEVFSVLHAHHSIEHQCSTKEVANLLKGASGENIFPDSENL